MPDITYSEFYKNLADGTAGTLEKIGDAAASLACGLWSSYPAAMAGTGINDPSTQLMSALYDRMCKPRNQEPAPPQQPFSGGQCDCVMYAVSVTAWLDGNFWFTNTNYYPGPISGGYLREEGSGFLSFGIDIGTPACGGRRRHNFISGFAEFKNEPGGAYCVINSVTRQDGAPDTCGSPSPQYPPTTIPPGEHSTNTPITINNTPIVVPVTIVPTTIVAPVFIRPTLNVDVGGVNVNFDLGGLTISLPNPSGEDKKLPPGDWNNPFPTDRPPASGQDIDLQPLKDALKRLEDDLAELKECACDEGSGVSLVGSALGSGRSGFFNLPADTVAVVCVVEKLSSNAKTEKGLSAPDVYYAGWGWFQFQGGMAERMPLDCGTKVFPWTNEFQPEKFGYTCREGYTATVTAYRRVDEE